MNTNEKTVNSAGTQSAEIDALPMEKIVQIAWRAIKVRIWRSLLVVSGIVLAIAFLTYILCSDALLRGVLSGSAPELLESLVERGEIDLDGMSDQRVQTFWMVGLALLISFVGIINAMLMSVTERFREIGTMKCLGALDGFVLRLFLLESTFEGALGSLLGLVLGAILSYGEGVALYGSAVWTLVSLPQLLLLLAGCALAGMVLAVLGALYPAYQAARMTPVMALRSEI